MRMETRHANETAQSSLFIGAGHDDVTRRIMPFGKGVVHSCVAVCCCHVPSLGCVSLHHVYLFNLSVPCPLYTRGVVLLYSYLYAGDKSYHSNTRITANATAATHCNCCNTRLLLMHSATARAILQAPRTLVSRAASFSPPTHSTSSSSTTRRSAVAWFLMLLLVVVCSRTQCGGATELHALGSTMYP